MSTKVLGILYSNLMLHAIVMPRVYTWVCSIGQGFFFFFSPQHEEMHVLHVVKSNSSKLCCLFKLMWFLHHFAMWIWVLSLVVWFCVSSMHDAVIDSHHLLWCLYHDKKNIPQLVEVSNDNWDWQTSNQMGWTCCKQFYCYIRNLTFYFSTLLSASFQLIFLVSQHLMALS